MSNFIDELGIKNSKGKKSKFSAHFPGMQGVTRYNTISELVDDMWRTAQTFQYTDWWTNGPGAMISIQCKNDKRDLEVIWKEVVTKEVTDALSAKKSIIQEINKNSTSSAFNAKLTPCIFTPDGSLLNDEDKKFLKDLYFCEENQLVYGRTGDSLKLIGDPRYFNDKNVDDHEKLMDYVEDRLARENGCTEEYDIWRHFYKTCDQLTEAYRTASLEMNNAMAAGKSPSDSYIIFGDNEEKFSSILKCRDNNWPDSAEDDLLSYFVKIGLNVLFPTIIFNRNMINLFYETKNDEFKRLAIKPIERNKKQTAGEIAAAIFDYKRQALKCIKKIDKVPHIIHDDPNVPAAYHLDENWMDKLPEGQKDVKDCKILNTFLRKFDSEESIFMMAWAYSVFHPSMNEIISLCLMTGGGTFKTSYYAKAIITILSLMYNENENKLVAKLKKDEWVNNDQFKEPKGAAGISTAGLIFNDECEQKSIEQFKMYSGSSNEDGITYTYKIVYQQPITTKIWSPWLFATNKSFQIEDSDGVFTRRLALIDRRDLSTFEPPYPISEFGKMRDLELKAFYETAKSAYKKIKEKYGSLATAAVKIDRIATNLVKAYNEDAKTVAYKNIYDMIVTASSTAEANKSCGKAQDNEGREYYWVLQRTLHEYIKQVAEPDGINPAGMLKWIDGTNKTTAISKTKTTKKVYTDGHWGVQNVAKLYPLRDEVMSVLEEEN